MTILTIIAGPSMRAEHAYGVCSGFGTGLDRVNHFAGVWSEHTLSPTAQRSLSQRPRPDAVSTLDPQRASAPPRRSP